jgi:hypothetical protein
MAGLSPKRPCPQERIWDSDFRRKNLKFLRFLRLDLTGIIIRLGQSRVESTVIRGDRSLCPSSSPRAARERFGRHSARDEHARQSSAITWSRVITAKSASGLGLKKGTLKAHLGYVSVRRLTSCDAGARFGTAQSAPRKKHFTREARHVSFNVSAHRCNASLGLGSLSAGRQRCEILRAIEGWYRRRTS